MKFDSVHFNQPLYFPWKHLMISVLLPVYNGEKYLRKSLDSVLNQTYEDFELLIGFNGTTDKSKDIVHSLNDQRIKVFDYGEDKGKGKTLNKLLKESNYDWVALQDDDDIWNSFKLDKQIKFINVNYDVIGTQIKYINENDIHSGDVTLVIEPHLIKYYCLLGYNQVANSSTLIRKDSLISVGGWKEDIDGIEDFDLWIRMLKNDKNFINLNEILVFHRLHTNSNFNTKKFDISKIL